MRRFIALAILGFVPACTAGSGDTNETTPEQCSDGADNDGDRVIDCADPGCTTHCSSGDGGPRPDAPFEVCEGDPYLAELAYAPLDIVWIVDNSGSMSDEAAAVQENMDNFAAEIGGIGLDWHVVMITTASFVSVPEPLASDPRYLFLETDVQSNEPLMELIAQLPRYRDHLRRSAILHFVAVTDDESALAWEDFRTMMRTALGYGFIFHTISSDDGYPVTFMNPSGACTTPGGMFGDGAAAPGVQYWELANATGGLALSICTPASEWATLFDSLTAAVAIPMRIPCEYEIPEPPAGVELDYRRVNIHYTPSTGDDVYFPYAERPDGIDCRFGGWYYDNPDAPTRIILCPDSCDTISEDTGARVDVELGCESILI